ncbi:universal stress protein [Croceitalea sp. MTPC9]|uniref:Universal stress protein n=1 Tax=Croceitalea marina TaxID=1775166 RepID=A0ABW5MV50_9FLAO|nr:universal stress protein [Croceitalea sp. MTPC6]GMN17291.1 universal stress protein [Croceitalea sp. MTPC9]
MKILLAIDGSDYSKAAVEELSRLSFPSNTEVRILSVYENPILATPGIAPLGGSLGGYYEEVLSNAKKSAEENVKVAARQLQNKNTNLSVSKITVNGLPKMAILDEAETFGAELIVVGSHGHGAFKRFLLGSVSQSVAVHADCSVLIVRKPNTEEKR